MKALASDFDRTLFFYDESGSYYRLEDVQAIKHFQSLGNLFGVCTGRSYKGIEDFNPHQIDYDFYILCSGAKILDKEGNLIYQKFIDKKIAQSIYEQYEAVDTSIVYQGDMYVLNRTFDLSPRVKLITSFNQVGEQFEAFSLHFKNNGEAGKEYTKMIDMFGDVIDVYQNERHLDFAAKGCSKGKGIKRIIEFYGLAYEDMAAIGDSWNDIPMLKSVENSFTFNRSHQTVKNVAKYLVDGIDGCIEELIKCHK